MPTVHLLYRLYQDELDLGSKRVAEALAVYPVSALLHLVLGGSVVFVLLRRRNWRLRAFGVAALACAAFLTLSLQLFLCATDEPMDAPALSLIFGIVALNSLFSSAVFRLIAGRPP